MSLLERFTILAESTSPVDRKHASSLLARNTDILPSFIHDIHPVFERLLLDATPEVAANAIRHAGVIATASVEADPVSGYSEIFDHSLFANLCQLIFSDHSEILHGTLLDAFRMLTLHMRASERSERLFRVLVPGFLSDHISARIGALSLVSVATEFLSEPEVRGFLVPLVISTASDAQYVVRKSSIPAIARLAKYVKSVDVFAQLCEDPQQTVREEAAKYLHVLGSFFMKADHKTVIKCMKRLLYDASIGVAREAAFNVVHWIALCGRCETEVPSELVNEFKDVFALFVNSNASESAIRLAERFGEALQALGPDRIDEETFVNAVAVFNRAFDIPSQKALAKALPIILNVVGVAHTYALLDMFIKTHREYEIFAAALDSLLDVIPRMPENLTLRLLVTLSLQPKRHVGAWRRRMSLAERMVRLAETCSKTFSESNFLTDAVRHVLVPLWTRLLADPASAVREKGCASSGKLVEILLAGNNEYRKNFLDHIWFVFGKSQTAAHRQVFIRFAVALLDERVDDDEMIRRLASLEHDQVKIVRNCFEACRAVDRIKDKIDVHPPGGNQSQRVRSASDVGWIFGEHEQEVAISESSLSDFSSDRPSTTPADYVEEGEALDAWTAHAEEKLDSCIILRLRRRHFGLTITPKII